MKRIVILTAVAMSAGVAYADPITVMTPKAGASVEEKAAYVVKLDAAVKEVCEDLAAPLVGLNYFAYQTCLKQTRVDVAKQDPTGLYAARESVGGTVVAAK